MLIWHFIPLIVPYRFIKLVQALSLRFFSSMSVCVKMGQWVQKCVWGGENRGNWPGQVSDTLLREQVLKSKKRMKALATGHTLLVHRTLKCELSLLQVIQGSSVMVVLCSFLDICLWHNYPIQFGTCLHASLYTGGWDWDRTSCPSRTRQDRQKQSAHRRLLPALSCKQKLAQFMKRWDNCACVSSCHLHICTKTALTLWKKVLSE